MKNKALKYETVAEICDWLTSKGEKPSYLLVNAELEGSPSKTTVLKHIHTWKTSKLNMGQNDIEISKLCMVALITEIQCHMQKVGDEMLQRVEIAEKTSEEALKLLAKCEKELQRLQALLIQAQERLVLMSHELDKKDAVHAEQIKALEQRHHDEMTRKVKKNQVKRRPPAKNKGAA